MTGGEGKWQKGSSSDRWGGAVTGGRGSESRGGVVTEGEQQ